MQTQEFLGRVQDKAHLANLEEALRATQATLETLGERLGPDEAQQLGAQLPPGLQLFLVDSATPQAERFSSEEFLLRVCAREGVDLSESTQHARIVIDVLTEAVSEGEIDDMLDRLPADYQRLFGDGHGDGQRRPPS